VRRRLIQKRLRPIYTYTGGELADPGPRLRQAVLNVTPETDSHVVSKLTVMTITMYGADWCRDCVRAEKFFVDNNIEFQKIDLKLDENEHFVESEVLRRNNGKKSIPVIVFDDDSHLTEPTNAQLAEKLGLLS
jgi:mycoredoxin